MRVRDARGRFYKHRGFDVTVLRHAPQDFPEGSAEWELLMAAFALIRHAKAYVDLLK